MTTLKISNAYRVILTMAAVLQLTPFAEASDYGWDTSTGYDCCRQLYESGRTKYFFGDCIPMVTKDRCM